MTSAIADSESYCLIEAPPILGPIPEPSARRRSQSSPKLAPNHSPTPSYSSSSGSSQHNFNRYPSTSQLPIGVANSPGYVHLHSSGNSSNAHCVSRTSSFTPLQTGVTLSMATLAPIRRDVHPEVREETATRSTLPPLSSSTRTRSHSNAIPTSMKQFHLPTGMVHRSQSHAQLRNGDSVPSTMLSSHDLQTSKGSSLLPVSGGAGVAPRLAKKSVVSPPLSRTHSSTPSVSVPALGSRACHSRQTSDILDRLESRVPSLSSSFSRNAVYFDSEDISEKLDELLLLAKEEVENRVIEEDEDTVAEGEEWVDIVKGHSRGEGSISQPIPPNTPANGYFDSTLSVAESQGASATSGGFNGAGFYVSPEAGSSQVYLGSNPVSQNQSIEHLSGMHLYITQDGVLPPSPAPPSIDADTTIGEVLPIVDSVPQEKITEASPEANMHVALPKDAPTTLEPIEDEEMMEEALALARELAVEDRMTWGVRASLEVFDDCWSEFEDEEMGVGVCTDGVPRMSVGPGPYSSLGTRNADVSDDREGHVKFRLGGEDGHDIRGGGLAPPSLSRWSLTSSIDEEKRMSLEERPKKKRRSFVPFIVSSDKDKEPKDDGHKEGTVGKKRNRLASFISRLSTVGLGGSGSNTPSLRTPPLPMLSPSSSSNALPGLFSVPLPSKRESPSFLALTPDFSPSRSSSPTALSDLPQIQRQPRVTIIADDDCSISSPSSSRLILTSFISTANDSPLPTSRPPTPPTQTISMPPMNSRRPIPLGIVIPPLPTHPPPELPTVVPLGKAASEGLINPIPHTLMSRPRSNSTTDSFGRHVTFTSSLTTPPSASPRMEQATMTLPSTLRRSVLAKSASASVLGLHQQVKPIVSPNLAAGAGYDDGLVPPTPTSIISTEEYGEPHRREDFYDDVYGLQPKRLRLRAMSSLGSLPLHGIVNPGPPRTKGGIKGFVGRLTGRGKNPVKVNQVHLPPSSFGTESLNHRSVYDSELPTPVATDSRKTSPKHSPSPSFSNRAGGGNAAGAVGGSGILSGFKLYLEKTPLRQS